MVLFFGFYIIYQNYHQAKGEYVNILKKMLLNLAISSAIAYQRLIWTAKTIWLALGLPVATLPEVECRTRSVDNWLRWTRWVGKEADDQQIVELITKLGLLIMARAP